MRWLADENVPATVVRALRADAHDAARVTEVEPGASDVIVLNRAREEFRVLLTLDRDLGELIFLRGAQSPPGLVYVRMVPPDVSRFVAALQWLVRESGVRIEGKFVVLDADGARSRPLP